MLGYVPRVHAYKLADLRRKGKNMVLLTFLVTGCFMIVSCIYWPTGHGWSLFFWCFMVFIVGAVRAGHRMEKMDKEYEAGLPDPQEHGDPLKQDVEVKP